MGLPLSMLNFFNLKDTIFPPVEESSASYSGVSTISFFSGPVGLASLGSLRPLG